MKLLHGRVRMVVWIVAALLAWGLVVLIGWLLFETLNPAAGHW